MPKFTPISVHDLGDYLKEQRHSAGLTLRQPSEAAGISNPYLSQIERGLKKPSVEILQALARALRISAESLYVRAGILEERTDLGEAHAVDVPAAFLADPALSNRQRAVLLDVYESFVGQPAPGKSASRKPAPRKAPSAKKPTRPRQAKPRPAPRPAPSSPDPAVNTTKENQS